MNHLVDIADCRGYSLYFRKGPLPDGREENKLDKMIIPMGCKTIGIQHHIFNETR